MNATVGLDGAIPGATGRGRATFFAAESCGVESRRAPERSERRSSIESDLRADVVVHREKPWWQEPHVFLFACESCGDPRVMFARIDGRLRCADCWRLAGSPWPGGGHRA